MTGIPKKIEEIGNKLFEIYMEQPEDGMSFEEIVDKYAPQEYKDWLIEDERIRDEAWSRGCRL